MENGLNLFSYFEIGLQTLYMYTYMTDAILKIKWLEPICTGHRWHLNMTLDAWL